MSARLFLSSYILVLAFGAVSVSCGTEKHISSPQPVLSPRPELIPDLDNPGPDSSYGEMGPLSGEVIISFTEGHRYYSDVGAPVFFMYQKTAFIYANYNYSIVQDISVSPGEIDFSHQGVFFPDVRLPATGPARARAAFRMANGDYRVSFEYRDVRDRYDITIDDTLVRIIQVDSNYTQSTHQLFWRYRPSSFAVSCGTTTETSFLCQEFVDSLLANLKLSEFFYPDTGMIPFARTSSGHYYDTKTRFFVYDGEENFQIASDALERFTLNIIAGQKGIGISLESWRNERARSWLFPGGR
jgi:hypothetical protein